MYKPFVITIIIGSKIAIFQYRARIEKVPIAFVVIHGKPGAKFQPVQVNFKAEKAF